MATKSSILGIGSLGIGTVISYLDAPGAGMLIGFGIAWLAFNWSCRNCPARKENSDE